MYQSLMYWPIPKLVYPSHVHLYKEQPFVYSPKLGVIQFHSVSTCSNASSSWCHGLVSDCGILLFICITFNNLSFKGGCFKFYELPYLCISLIVNYFMKR